ncbi:CaiB/BaiF CoA transferase family protein [Piscinibacter koreensis]|uniref:CoA transferase n=1 Tax=Piscinibacter koreensis TaxID=2742824 RepID=A0A7Y6NRE7_9BURK|nr:CoA transferase [Schlegelella koreensis]NUZ07951.1 CoA transferase [Schlegelella koreensis]
MSGPLEGTRVLDLTSVVMGPYATQLLADYGADVIKIEPPEGDVMRQSGPMRNPGMGHFYLTTNRNKRSVVLDLKKPDQRDALLRMAEQADVLVYNIRPKAMARLGLSYEEVSAAAPRIVYAGAYGFGRHGPYAARPAYDDLIQGMCGIPWLSRAAGAEPPRYAPMVLVDRIVGLQLCAAISSALVYRERTGHGQRLDVPMFEGMLSLVLGEHLAGRLYEPAEGAAGYQRSLAHDRRPYPTSDGYVCVLVYNDKHWRSFLTAIGQGALFETDARFSSQNARLAAISHVYGFLAATLAQRTTSEWLELFERADIPAARMYSIEDIVADEHVQATGFLRKVRHPSEGDILETAVPTEWSRSPPQMRRHAPRLGEHTEEVLAEFGLSPAGTEPAASKP